MAAVLRKYDLFRNEAGPACNAGPFIGSGRRTCPVSQSRGIGSVAVMSVMMVVAFAAAFPTAALSARAARSERGVAPLRGRKQYGDGRRSDNREFAACGEKMTPRLNGRVLGFLF